MRETSYRRSCGATCIAEPGEAGTVIGVVLAWFASWQVVGLFVQYSGADPSLDEEGHEFADVDVIEVRVDVDFFVLAEVPIARREATVEKVLAR